MYQDAIVAIGIFVMLLFVAFFAFFYSTFSSYQHLRKNGRKVQGEITDYEEYSNNKGLKTVFPIIRFRTSHGEEIHQRTLYGITTLKPITKGAVVEVLYAENDPSRFILIYQNPFKGLSDVLMGFAIGFALAISAFLLTINNFLLK